jgi:hypothetical protein
MVRISIDGDHFPGPPKLAVVTRSLPQDQQPPQPARRIVPVNGTYTAQHDWISFPDFCMAFALVGHGSELCT